MLGAQRTISFTRVLVFFAALSACAPRSSTNSSSTDSEELATLARENLLRPLRGAAETGRFLSDSSPLAAALALGEPPSTATQSYADLRAALNGLDQTLRERVFVPGNRMDDATLDAGTTSFLVPAELWCDHVEQPTQDGIGGAHTAECMTRFEHYTPRILLRESGSSDVKAELQIGEPARPLAELNLFHNKVEVNVDFGVVFEVTRSIHEDLSPFSEFSGGVSLSLERLAERHYAFECRLLDDILMVLTSHGGLATARVEAGAPFTWSIDGREPNLTSLDVQLAVGKVQVEGALHTFQDLLPAADGDAPPPPYEGSVHFELGGLKARAHIDNQEDVLHVTDLGLGVSDTQLLFDGKLTAKLMLAALGRHAVRVDFEAAEQALGARFLTNPQLSLIAEFHNLSRQVPRLPESLLSNVFSFQLEGETPGLLQFSPGQMRVVEGTLKLDTADMPERSQSVGSGQCVHLVDSKTEDAPEAAPAQQPAPPESVTAPTASLGPDTPFGRISVGACP